MRPNRTLSLIAALAALAVAATSALACGDSATKVSGTFDKDGHFVLAGAWAKDGTAIANTHGMVLESFTTEKNLAISASSLAGKQVCLFGDLDVEHKTMQVSGFKECGAGACGAGVGAQASAASAGAGCCAAKGAAAASANGASCAAKGATAAVNPGMAAQASNSPAGCCASKSAAKGVSASAASTGKTPAAAASSGPCMKGANAAASSPMCHGDAAATKAAKAESKDATMLTTLVYKVSGMHCGNCATKVQGAVAALAIPNVTECAVNVEKGQAVVTTKGDVDRDAIQKAITAAGFPAELTPVEATKS